MAKDVYYTVTIWYSTYDEGVKFETVNNITRDKYLQFREQVFSCGLQVKDKDDPSTGNIIPPSQIIQVKFYIQAHFFQGVWNSPVKKQTS